METLILRHACRDDIPALMKIRGAVLENRLISRSISFEDYVQAIECTGRGWVIESQGEVIAFAICNSEMASLWALFVLPAHEKRGCGRLLLDSVVNWARARGLDRLWLTTDPGTRAQRFYERAGWICRGPDAHGELRFELNVGTYGR